MKEKEKFSNPSVRHNGLKEKEIHHVSLLYSAGEDYYNIYHEDRVAEPDKTKISVIRSK